MLLSEEVVAIEVIYEVEYKSGEHCDVQWAEEENYFFYEGSDLTEYERQLSNY